MKGKNTSKLHGKHRRGKGWYYCCNSALLFGTISERQKKQGKTVPDGYEKNKCVCKEECAHAGPHDNMGCRGKTKCEFAKGGVCFCAELPKDYDPFAWFQDKYKE